MKQSLNRREFLTRLGLTAVAVGAVASLSGCEKKDDGAAAKCDDTTSLDDGAKATRTSLKYVDKSSEAGKECKLCQHYVEPAAGVACGGCKLFKGTVSPVGYCSGFAAKA